MKKSLSIFVLSLCLFCFTNCASYYSQSSYTSSKCYVGMSIQEFKNIAKKKAVLEAMKDGMTVFRMNDYSPMNGGITDTKFFYFDSYGKLLRIDGGVFRESRQKIDLNIN